MNGLDISTMNLNEFNLMAWAMTTPIHVKRLPDGSVWMVEGE